jgi:hypothetical protein
VCISAWKNNCLPEAEFINNFVEVYEASGIQCLNYNPVSNHFCSGGGGGGDKIR